MKLMMKKIFVNRKNQVKDDGSNFIKRRSVMVGAASLGLLPAMGVFSRSEAEGAESVGIGLKFAFAARVTLDPPKELGVHDGIRKRFIPINGGTVEGPTFNATILPGGGDWQEVGSDGVTDIHARYFMKASDGTIIGIDNAGVRVADPEIIARLTAGEEVNPDLYYFRTAARFEAPQGTHEWLRRKIFVCQGIRHPNDVVIKFYEVT